MHLRVNADPLKWATFIERFTAAVDSQDSLNVLEKSTYLKGQLEGQSADCVQGLTSKNYEEMKQLLQERFGNPLVIISAHMNVLLKLPKIMIVYHVYLPFIIQLKVIFTHF